MHIPSFISSIRWRLIVWPSLLLLVMGSLFVGLHYRASLKQFELVQTEHLASAMRVSDQLLNTHSGQMIRLLDEVSEEMLVRPVRVGYEVRPNVRLQAKLRDLVFMQGVTSLAYFDLHDTALWWWGKFPQHKILDSLKKTSLAQEQPSVAIICDDSCNYWLANPVLFEGKTIGVSLIGGALENFVLELRHITNAEVGIVHTPRRSHFQVGAAPAKVLVAAGGHVKLNMFQSVLTNNKNSRLEYVTQGRTFWLEAIPWPRSFSNNEVQLYIVSDVTDSLVEIRSEWLLNLTFVLLLLVISLLLMRTLLSPILKAINQLGLALPMIGEERFSEVSNLINFEGERYIPDELDRISFAVLGLSARMKKLIEAARTQTVVLQEQSTMLEKERDLIVNLLANVPVMILVYDDEGIIRLCNAAVGQLLDQQDLQTLVGCSFPDLLLAVSDQDVCQKIPTHGVLSGASRVTKADGTIAEISWLHVRLQLDAQMPTYLAVGTDVTQRLAVEFELEHAQEQREMVVREVHHRIKNNLQGAVGLLSVYAEQHPDVRPVLLEVISQIKSIAVVFGLQGKRNVDAIYFDELLAEVVAVNVDLTHAKVRLEQTEVAVRALLLPDKAVSVALVINELIVNAVKYNADPASSISVSYCHLGNVASVTVRNQASALPRQFDFAKGVGLGTGLTLARFMLPKKGAELSIEHEREQVVATLQLQPPILYVNE